MATNDRKSYSKEFKRKTVRLSYERSIIKELAHEMGVLPALIYRWRKESKDFSMGSFPGHGKK